MPRANADTREQKLKVVLALASGASIPDAAKQAGVNRQRVHRWMKSDEEFQAIRQEFYDQVVKDAVQDIRGLSKEVVAVFREALAIRHRTQVIQHAGNGDVELIDVPDMGQAVRTADLVAKRIAEFIPKTELEVGASQELARIIMELDGDDARA